ncbi:MAG: sigma-E factor negative regulatory protein [Burkholderiaceae bacterium]|jgi:sigma-E factor negative regulatory protein RseA|nr:sigma-E factor negative regulatory protein [Burkholderiaceae bacterium]
MNNEYQSVEPSDDPAVSISALMDGALSGPQADAALAAATQPEGEQRWRLYHLIGDTLRAPDLAAHHDAGLPGRVRAAIQPGAAMLPEFAPPPVALGRQAANDGVFRWKLASGFASVVAVAAIGWNVWSGVGHPHGQQFAQTQPFVSSQVVVASAVPAVPVADGVIGARDAQYATSAPNQSKPEMLRNPQLDRLLAEHRQMAAFGEPSTFLRYATFEEPAR